MRQTIYAGALLLAISSTPALARDLVVPENYKTIRAAVRDAEEGDRIVLASGAYMEKVNCRLSNVTFVSTGGVWLRKGRAKYCLRVRGDDVTVEGIPFQGGGVQIRGDRARVVSTTFAGSRSRRVLSIRGDDSQVEEVRIGPGPGCDNASRAEIGLEIRGDRARVSSSEVAGFVDLGGRSVPAGFRIVGDDAVVQDNLVRLIEDGPAMDLVGDRAELTSNTIFGCTDGISITGDDAHLASNIVRGGSGRGIDVSGDRANVVGNGLFDRVGVGITVEGRGFDVDQNRVVMDQDSYGRAGDTTAAGAAIQIRNTGGNGAVTGNVVRHDAGSGLQVAGGRVDVCDNSVTSHPGAATSIEVDGSGNLVQGNDVPWFETGGILVTGDANDVCRNEVIGRGPQALDPRADAIVIAGDGNVVEDNSASQAPQNAFHVTGSRNELTGNRASESGGDAYCIAAGEYNSLVGCEGMSSALRGLENLATDTDVIDCEFRGNGLGDIFNDGSFGRFESNRYGNFGGIDPR